jgi:monovalent cation/proton antiporter MnhG/PhaG subunit
MTQIIAIILISLGFFLNAVSAIGVLRMPTFYTRQHVAGMIDSLGLPLTLLGFAIYHGFSLTSVKILFIIVFVMVTNPVSTHLLCKAAYYAGLREWDKKKTKEIDENWDHLP